MKKIVLGGRGMIECIKHDLDYAGSLYLELPRDDMMIDVNYIPDDVDTLYVSFHSRYMFFLWQNFDKLAHLNIYLRSTINHEPVFFAYPSSRPTFNLEMFHSVQCKKIEQIYLIGTSEDAENLYRFLVECDYPVTRICEDEIKKTVSSMGETSSSIVLNGSSPLDTVYSSYVCESFILNNEIQTIIRHLSAQTIALTAKNFVDFLLSGYAMTRYNPFAALAYVYQNALPRTKEKSIAFYAPSCAYRNNFMTKHIYAEALKQYNTYFFYGTLCEDTFEKLENSYYVGNCLIGYFEFLDIIIYPALTLVLPKNPKKLYMFHDIYDSPLGIAEEPVWSEETQQLEVSKFLDMVDYMFVPGPSVMKGFSHKLMKNVCFIPGGYFKLDGNIKRFHAYKDMEVKSIIYAPTVINDVLRKHHSQPLYGIKIVKALLENFRDYTIIFRPHPHSISDVDTLAIVEAFHTDERFIFDNNPSDYIYNYSRSKLMVTDISGTAFTYAFTTLRPVVFFSVDEAHAEADMGGVSYFKDRCKIGAVVENIEELIATVNAYLTYYDNATKSVEAFRAISVYNVESSENYFMNNLSYILEDSKHPDWIYLREGKIL